MTLALPRQAPPFDPERSPLLPLINDLHILHKQRLEVVKFHGVNGPNAAQLYYLNNFEHQLRTTGRVRTIILKARQMGFSTMTEALAFLFCFIHKRYRVLVVSHEKESAEHLLSMTKLFWEHSDYAKFYTTSQDSASGMAWRETKSRFTVLTAGSRELARSRTGFFLHASEVAFWEDASRKMLGLRQSIPNTDNTVIILESTANGIGNFFHSTWEEAVKGENEYTPLFFPWFQDPTYRASIADPSGQIIERIPYNAKLDDAERILVTAFGVDRDQLAWRRWAIKNLTEENKAFEQEYPATPEEAFIATGHNVFPEPALRAIYEPESGTRGRLVRDGNRVRLVEDPTGPYTIYRLPHPECRYIIGTDPTRNAGNDKKADYACMQVLNRETLEQVAVFHQRIDSDTLGREAFKLGLFYNTAIVAPEKQGPGNMTVGVLLGMNYPRVFAHAKFDKTPGKTANDIWGWSTTEQTKPAAITKLLRVILDGYDEASGIGMRIHHPLTYSELKKFIQDGTEYRPADEDFGGHDDTVMALAIATAAHFLEAPIGFDDADPDANADLFAVDDSTEMPEWLRILEDA